jgi:uncharacterized protein (DUF1778 family)
MRMTGADFVQDGAERAADEVVMERALVRTSLQGFGAFMAAIETPAAAAPELVELFKRRVHWATSAD